jgi:hypothetical protein
MLLSKHDIYFADISGFIVYRAINCCKIRKEILTYPTEESGSNDDISDFR